MKTTTTNLFFDIDGTLLRSDGVGRTIIAKAMEEVFNMPLSLEGISFGGKTDFQILREIVDRNDIDLGELPDSILEETAEVYIALMRRYLQRDHIKVLDGVTDLLSRLQEDSRFRLAILTGNLEPTAHLKLELAGLRDYFHFGVYGSDHSDRYKLPSIALDRASAYTNENVHPDHALIIGDTEHDILCGRSIGVRSIGVCTGHYSYDDLVVHRPDALFHNLENTDEIHAELVRLCFSNGSVE